MLLIENTTSALRRFFISKMVFGFIMVSFIISMAWVIHIREGKDLKVGLFGVEQVLQKKSPYDNPTDPNRTIYRYAPGITILQYPFLMYSKSIKPFYYKDITPSALAWYFTVLLSLFFSLLLLRKLIPTASSKIGLDNLKLSLLMALPFIGYELSNGQNKLLALFFMLLALYLFEKKRFFLSAISFCVGLTIYIALLPFIFYFLIRKKSFILHFAGGALVVFFVVPSFFFGFNFNNFLLSEWFRLSLKPFFFADSYMAYIDLRHSNQALPGVIGRIFVAGNTDAGFRYAISPLALHLMIRVFAAVFVFFSIFAAWKNKQAARRGLCYAVFFILPLLLPQYCIYYTWAWVIVLYYAIFNYVDSGEASQKEKGLLLGLVGLSFLSLCLIGFNALNKLSLIFWSTAILWAGLITVLISNASKIHLPDVPGDRTG